MSGGREAQAPVQPENALVKFSGSSHYCKLEHSSDITCKTPIPNLLDPYNTAKMSVPSMANFIIKRPWLRSWMKPLASWYANAAGYRKLGLRYERSK
jgi:hypothetical protein